MFPTGKKVRRGSVSFTEKQQRETGTQYNFRTIPAEVWKSILQVPQGIPAVLAAACGLDAAAYSRELPGMSADACSFNGRRNSLRAPLTR